MTQFLVDSSVLQRLVREPSVAVVLERLIEAGHVLCSSPTSVLEAGYSARSPEDNDAILTQLTSAFELLPLTTEVGTIAVELQRALFAAGSGRAAGVVDLLQSAVAVVHDATVLHYDADFEHLAQVDPRVRQAWVVLRGSID